MTHHLALINDLPGTASEPPNQPSVEDVVDDAPHLDEDRAPDADFDAAAERDDDAAPDPAPDLVLASRLLADGLVLQRGEPETWTTTPVRSGLASAVIHAVMSPRLAPPVVDAVVTRYEQRFAPGGDADDLVASFVTLGAQGWQDEIGTRHRTAASLEAPYKSDVIEQAARMLQEHGYGGSESVLARLDDPVLRAAWRALPGQSSGFSWRHLLGALGVTQIRTCPLTRRFVRRWAGRAVADLPDDEILDLLAAVAQRLDTDLGQVADQTWRAATPPRPAALG